jgi:hypothetical protein
MSQIVFDKSTAPSSPSVNSIAIYFRLDGILCSKNELGEETEYITKSQIGYVSSTTKTSDYVVLSTDYIIRLDATANAINITLPSAITLVDKTFIFKRVDGTSNKVYISTVSGQTIDGDVTIDLQQQFTSITIHTNGVSWDII